MTALKPADTGRAASGRVTRARRVRAAAFPYLNRELSWLEFNARVLHEARDERNPLLERAKFLAIFASNLDEFFQVRIAGLRQQVQTGSTSVSADGRTAPEQLAASRARVLELVAEHSVIWTDVKAALHAEGIAILDYDEVPDHHTRLRERFLDEIFPVLTPLAVDPGHPFPYISTLSLSIAVGLRDPDTGERRFARVKVPPILPRLLELDHGQFVLIDQVIEANLDLLFSGMEILETHLFRVTRNADLAIEEDEADDLMSAIEEELRRRRFGEAVRLEVERSMPATTRALLIKGIGLAEEDCFEVAGMVDLTSLWQIVAIDRPDLKDAPWTPVTPARLQPPDDDEAADIFAAIRAGDVLVHHPYESFASTTERFIAQAADDPEVLSIKMTLYRTSGDSPIVQSLIRAAERGKQVVVLVEIKARFDEEANIVWARKLERAGAHVVYGLVGLKTHSKTALVVRREGSFLRRYVHIGTGNYNPRTARLYVDIGLLSCRDELGADVTDLFNVLTGLSRQRTFRRLLVAPHTLRTRFLDLVDREIAIRRIRTAGPDRDQVQRDRRPGLHRGPLPGQPGRGRDRPDRPGDVRSAAGCRRRVRSDPGPLHRRGVPRALPDLAVRERRARGVVHRVGRPDGAQPRPTGRGGRARRGQRGPGADRRDHRGDARRRPPQLAAPVRRDVAPDRGDRGPGRHDRHVRGPQGTRALARRRLAYPASTWCRRRVDGPACLTG